MKGTNNMQTEKFVSGSFALNCAINEDLDAGSIRALVLLAPLTDNDNFFFSGCGVSNAFDGASLAREVKTNIAVVRGAISALYEASHYLQYPESTSPAIALGVAACEYYNWDHPLMRSVNEIYNEIKSTEGHFLASVCGSDTILRSVITAGLGLPDVPEKEEGSPEREQEQEDPVARTAAEWYIYLSKQPDCGVTTEDIITHINNFVVIFGTESIKGLVAILRKHLPAVNDNVEGARELGAGEVRDYILTLVPKEK
jgi:hypothetical protein